MAHQELCAAACSYRLVRASCWVLRDSASRLFIYLFIYLSPRELEHTAGQNTGGEEEETVIAGQEKSVGGFKCPAAQLGFLLIAEMQ